jgi:hypothetical protein
MSIAVFAANDAITGTGCRRFRASAANEQLLVESGVAVAGRIATGAAGRAKRGSGLER